MSPQLLLADAIRWVGLAGLAALVGSLLVEALLLPRDAPESARAAERLRRLGRVCLTVLVATTAGELLARARTMAGGDLAAAVAAIPVVLARTHFGVVWIARFVLLGAAFLVIARESRPARIAALGLGLGLTLTTSLTGHGADWGDLTWTAGIDWVHVVAVSAWTGGLLALALVVLGDADAWPPARLGVLMRRFSRLAGYCLVAALASGSYNAWVQLPRVSALWTTFYGRVLSVKLLLVLGVIALGAINRYLILPRLGRRRTSGIGERLFRLAWLVVRGSRRSARPGLPERLRVGVRGEAVLVVAVFAATAVLVDSTPARHAEHASHRRAEARGPFRVTMEELHESGGVPRGWVFTPPAGDVARGREVFLRLGCQACHKSGDERIRASSGLGPDLTGVGEHHPAAYILESILNPDAVIVQAPGYTTPEGRSIMPDYRGQLSVGELIDLVAYVQGL
jgi:putative copper export protein